MINASNDFNFSSSLCNRSILSSLAKVKSKSDVPPESEALTETETETGAEHFSSENEEDEEEDDEDDDDEEEEDECCDWFEWFVFFGFVVLHCRLPSWMIFVIFSSLQSVRPREIAWTKRLWRVSIKLEIIPSEAERTEFTSDEREESASRVDEIWNHNTN